MGVESQPQNQIPSDEIYGDFDQDDKPKKIIKVRRKGNEFEFIVEWL